MITLRRWDNRLLLPELPPHFLAAATATPRTARAQMAMPAITPTLTPAPPELDDSEVEDCAASSCSCCACAEGRVLKRSNVEAAVVGSLAAISVTAAAAVVGSCHLSW